MEYNFNEVTSDLTKELINKLSVEAKEEFFSFFDTVEFIQNLSSPKRRYSTDMPKDNLGRIIVDLTNPHILEDMDYFRQDAIHFQKYGVYTNAYPNSHPNSEFGKFWIERARRCREGYVRESDGEWIPGYFYWYLNFSPILLVKDLENPLAAHSKSKMTQAARDEDFPDFFDGDYLYYHYLEQAELDGEFGTVLKTRGRGFSFKGGAMCARNQVQFKKSRSYMMASETEYLNKDGIWNKYVDNLDFIADNTPWPSNRVKYDQNKMIIELGYVDPDKGTKQGMQSTVFGITLKNEPNKARGKRGKLILWEEAGKFPGLLKAWGIARMSLEQGRSVFGLMVAFGTGGTEGADFEALEKLFYYPRGYRVKALKNVFDKNASKGECAFFFPEYLNRQGCYDKSGNSDVIKALLEIVEDRDQVRKGTDDPHALTQEKADRPITPQEAVMRTGNNKFPVEQLKNYLESISPTIDSFLSEHLTGSMTFDSQGKVTFNQERGTPIRDFPLKDKLDKKGAVEIFELPKKGSNGEIVFGRYIGGIDTYDDDTGTSLGSIFIFDLWTDRIVAEYTGRPDFADDFYEICAALLEFYNAQANYENNKKGLFVWFSNNFKLHLLTDTLEILKDMDLVNKGELYGNKVKGTNATAAIKALGLREQQQWMRKNAYSEVAEEQVLSQIDEEDDINITEDLMNEIFVPNLRKIRSLGYIKEAIQWNPDGNFDRVDAMSMVMLLRLDKQKYISKELDNEKDLTDDDYFQRNYKDVDKLKNYFEDESTESEQFLPNFVDAGSSDLNELFKNI